VRFSESRSSHRRRRGARHSHTEKPPRPAASNTSALAYNASQAPHLSVGDRPRRSASPRRKVRSSRGSLRGRLRTGRPHRRRIAQVGRRSPGPGVRDPAGNVGLRTWSSSPHLPPLEARKTPHTPPESSNRPDRSTARFTSPHMGGLFSWCRRCREPLGQLFPRGLSRRSRERSRAASSSLVADRGGGGAIRAFSSGSRHSLLPVGVEMRWKKNGHHGYVVTSRGGIGRALPAGSTTRAPKPSQSAWPG